MNTRNKLVLPKGCSERGAQFGRRDELPDNLATPIKLRLEKLRWVDGDYDEGGAYWGNGNQTDIYCAHAGATETEREVRVFVRAATRAFAKRLVVEKVPNATFFDGPPDSLTTKVPGGAGATLELTLNAPFEISARLCAGLRVGNGWVSLEYAGVSPDRRTVYRYYIDAPNGKEFVAEDLKSGVGGATLQEGFASLLVFLDCAATGDNVLFPKWVNEWAAHNSSEIEILKCEVQDKKGLINENPSKR